MNRQEMVESFRRYTTANSAELGVQYGRSAEDVEADNRAIVAAFEAGWDAVDTLPAGSRQVPEALCTLMTAFTKGLEASAYQPQEPKTEEWPGEVTT